MGSLVTFGTPHLGCITGSGLVKTGIKFWAKYSKHLALRQMSMLDAQDIKDSFLMNLSTYEGLSWFEDVILFSSYQDYFVPFESARVEYGDWAQETKGQGRQLKKMADNILTRIRPNALTRVDMNFIVPKSFDSLIGRGAHMKIVEEFKVQSIFVYFFSQYFL
jgi:hypothetical protein